MVANKLNKKRGPKTKRKYWDENEMKLYFSYFLIEKDKLERDKIFQLHLYPNLLIMTESIFAIYFRPRNKFTLEEERDLINDVITHTITKAVAKFDFTKKSFSYFQTVVKNHLHNLIWNTTEKKRAYISIEDNVELIENLLNNEEEDNTITIDEVVQKVNRTLSNDSLTIQDKNILKCLIDYLTTSNNLNHFQLYKYFQNNIPHLSGITIDRCLRENLNMKSNMHNVVNGRTNKNNNTEIADDWFFESYDIDYCQSIHYRKKRNEKEEKD